MKKIIYLMILALLGMNSVSAIKIPGLKPKGSIQVGSIKSSLLLVNISSLTSPSTVSGSGASVGSGGGAGTIIAIGIDEDAPLTEGAIYDVGLFGSSGRVEPVGVTFAVAKGGRSGTQTLATNNDTVITAKIKVMKVSSNSVTLSIVGKAAGLTMIKASTNGDSEETIVDKETAFKITVNAATN